ncbi:sensor histidine kinase [Streptomyces albofaciens JCM 4342]|uniref:sensor histidine kinase n=1 Tax=Streptomyces albofaciens TaxID=66866 RepID=UPI001238DA64|nr:sensor histidine kinase [Streptomyces albofaciens]KAA6223138.1 sensor histidine kinase [Streptomyces albofaciens JCM 4342]
MENGRPPWARLCHGHGSRHGLGPDRWRSRDDDGDPLPGRRFGARLLGDSPAGTRLPWASTAVLTVFVLVGMRFAGRNQPERADLDALAYTLLLVGTVPLLWRHRFPRTVALGTAVAASGYLAAGYPYGPFLLSAALGCFAAVVAGRRVTAWTAVGLVWASHLLVGHVLYRWLPPTGDGPAPWGEQLFITVLVVAVVAVSELARVRREQFARMRAERAAAARRRADEERLRIARELHDVLAHSISVINVQAGVGLALLDEDPEQARTALTTIKAASKEVLGEVRQVLATLRAPGDAPRSPAPGLDRLPELCEQAKGAGLAVRVTEQGRRPRLSPGADLAAFRIVQEALTNIVRHSGSRTARVGLVHLPGALEITVDDDGPATAAGRAGDVGTAGVAGGGNGLVGMRERAAALGGTVEAGPRPDGGFRVHARLPLGPATPAPGAPGSARAADTVKSTATEEES